MPPSVKSEDAGALELGVESAWTRSDSFIAGADRDSSQWAEPTTDRLRDLGNASRNSRESPMAALEAPYTRATGTDSPTDGMDDVPSPLHSLMDSGSDNRSKAMSLEPIIDSTIPVVASSGVTTREYITMSKNCVSSPVAQSRSPSWADLPEDDELGEIPEFPIISPTPASEHSIPRIPATLKGKSVDPRERPDTYDGYASERPNQWTEQVENTTTRDHPNPDDHLHHYDKETREKMYVN